LPHRAAAPPRRRAWRYTGGVSFTYWMAVLAAPTAIVLAGRRMVDGVMLALVVTCAVTWMSIAGLITWIGDPWDIGLTLVIYFVILPLLTAAIAAVVATRVTRIRGRLVPAFLLALMGWVVGLGVGMIVFAAGVDELWDNAMAIALPAIYASCGAVFAASVRDD
jgi:hypothetical protein